ncbi:hypothetical protein GCK72_008660 [Caenorhabditis remanei]|uniref:Uncharacterized protein n=1 Tax=Caenorhabditis remanei TaxID=31234 RepID=E3NCU0_CAERE|nr:hypothetical protein GCK72_008660 [Caenorhabditis remanei]EFO93323.1 hypothetical protein CRE_24775 [Caenorhabditis remanei]KAF1760411.1 hypothetical protein GCK72_008660 [Caenorhabditis remanei]
MPRRMKNCEAEGQYKHPRTQEFRPSARRRQRIQKQQITKQIQTDEVPVISSPTENESPMCEATKTNGKRDPFEIWKEEIDNYKEAKKRAFYGFLVFVRIYIWRTKFVELEILNSIIFGLLAAVAQAEERVYREEDKKRWIKCWSRTYFYRNLWFFCFMIYMVHMAELQDMDKITGGTMAICLAIKFCFAMVGSNLGAYIGQFETILRDEHVGGATGGLLGFVIGEVWLKHYPPVSRFGKREY